MLAGIREILIITTPEDSVESGVGLRRLTTSVLCFRPYCFIKSMKPGAKPLSARRAAGDDKVALLVPFW